MIISRKGHSANVIGNDLAQLKSRLRAFAHSFGTCNIYDSNDWGGNDSCNKYALVAGIGIGKRLTTSKVDLFAGLDNPTAWVFGNMEYQDILHSPVCRGFFYEPKVVAYIREGEEKLVFINNGISEDEFETILEAWNSFELPGLKKDIGKLVFEPEVSKEQYTYHVESIRRDIIQGKYYELNYCIGFSAKVDKPELLGYFEQLNGETGAPFSAYVRNEEYTLLCSSPERFLCKRGNKLVSQPIKGTNRAVDGNDYQISLQELENSEKDRAENVMIVDLVRNDLARVCKTGTIKVEELCKGYHFRNVNHLISTVSGTLGDNSTFSAIMDSLFPMGSMTGAPKTEVMKHIAKYESSPRGIYSGCLGYVEPSGDFDFNVVIRSLVYRDGELSYKVGSAITYDSIPGQEYEECLLKGQRLLGLFKG